MNHRARKFVADAPPSEILRWHALFHGPTFHFPGPPPPQPDLSKITYGELCEMRERQQKEKDQLRRRRA